MTHCFIAAFVTVALFASIALSADKAATRPAGPDPSLNPEQVIKTVLAALRTNNKNDDGIRTTFKFASPDNQAVTGPVERFIPMVKSPAYAPLVNHDASKVKNVKVQGGGAIALVIVVNEKGDKAYYMWELSKQTEGALKDCWLTDAVVRVAPPDNDEDDFLKA